MRCKGVIGFVLGHHFEPVSSRVVEELSEDGKTVKRDRWNILLCLRCGERIDLSKEDDVIGGDDV